MSLLFLLFPSTAICADYAGELGQKALSMGLHERREWQVLMHYRPTLFGGYESLVDDPGFFNSSTGKTDPASELTETIKAFFAASPTGDLHPQCRFIARLKWLEKELSIDAASLPQADCKGFREFHDSVDPKSAVLVFPVSHMNSPASMFGHTLLRIDSAKESRLFSWAVNYTARTGETNGFFFALKGIFGYYEGYYGVLPYYEKIKEYSNLENRDIWEYDLEYTPEEIERMMLHLWELKDVYTYYYFFDENCSYNLLLVLEAARPGVDFIKTLPPWVMPMDTVKSIRTAGVSVKDAVYRPSKASRIRHLEKLVTPEVKSAAINTAEGGDEGVWKDAALPVGHRAIGLELASEYVQYRYAKGSLAKEEYTKLFLKVLGLRSALGAVPVKEMDAPVEPEGGHGPARLTSGAGSKTGRAFLSLSLRPANHSLSDPDAGYLPGAAITFMEAEARYFFEDRKLSLQKLTIVGIDSVAPRDEFFKPVSWALKAAFEREETSIVEHRTVFHLKGGPGVSYQSSSVGLAYGFVEPALKISSKLDKGYALGAAARAGVLTQLTANWKAQLELAAESFGPGDSHTILSAELNQTFSINTDNALILDLRRERFDGFYSTEALFGWSAYF